MANRTIPELDEIDLVDVDLTQLLIVDTGLETFKLRIETLLELINANLVGIAYNQLVLTGAVLSADLAAGIDAVKIGAGGVSNAEFGYLDGVTSALQTQLDNLNQGIKWKASVKVATTANITLSGTQTIDGIAVIALDRVLVKNQSTGADNGIYVVSAGAWSRSTDCDTSAEVLAASTTVEQGTINADRGYRQTADSITLGSTSLTWVQIFGAGTYTADGDGLEISGSTFGLELDGTSLSKSSSGLKVNAVTNAMTTAASANTASAIVTRDGSGNFSAGTITAALTGAVTGNVTGNVTGSSGSCTGNALTSSSCTGNAATSSSCSGNAATVTTNANATGDVTSIGNAFTYNGVVPIAKGGTALTAVAVAPVATTFAGWDANLNLSAVNFIEGYATTATAAGTTTLVVGSKFQQFFTGTSTQTVVLPVTSTLVLGMQFRVVNLSTGTVTVQSSGANNIQVQAGNSLATYTCILASGTTAASWTVAYSSLSGSAAGSGEKNYITSPNSTATGWTAVGDFTLSTSTTAAELPREFTTQTGIKFIAAVGTQSAADYIYFDFTLDDVDLSKKLKIEWSQKVVATLAATNLAVVITSQADRTTALHTPVTTAIPAADGVFTTSFDANTTATLSLVIRGTAVDMTTGDGLVISDVIVGPGTKPQGAIAQYLGSIGTMTVTGNGSKTFTVTNRCWRIGNSLKCLFSMDGNASASGSGAATVLQLVLPSGYTIDYTALPSSTNGTSFNYAGTFISYGIAVAAQYAAASQVMPYDTTSVAFEKTLTATTLTVADLNVARDMDIQGEFTIPISEWAGSGTINVVQNDVEYASVAGTWDAASTTTVYGPAGSALGGALATSRNKTITWQTAISPTDRIQLWGSTDRLTWLPLVGSQLGASEVAVVNQINAAGTGDAGVFYKNSGNTTVVRFNRYANVANDDAPQTDWPSDAYWCATKSAAGHAVGFGDATITSSGLVNTGTQTFAGAKTFQDGLTGITTTVSTTFTDNGTSPGTSSAVTLVLQKIGDWVTIFIPAFSATVGSGTPRAFTSNTAIPAAFRPLSSSTVTLWGGSMRNNGSNTGSATIPGCMQMAVAGTMTISRDAAQTAFTASSSCGLANPMTLTYYVGIGS